MSFTIPETDIKVLDHGYVRYVGSMGGTGGTGSRIARHRRFRQETGEEMIIKVEESTGESKNIICVQQDDLVYLATMIDANDIFDRSKNPGLRSTMLRILKLLIMAGVSPEIRMGGYAGVKIDGLIESLTRSLLEDPE